ncbi:hypothetical protein FSARC_277 [Fusarium sarcochroum]|uniref:Enoyl reductase (ER) domain-containing protein n=1 Tax=Fusarium sarcochroum TaxID=1208366 RepID=A0A8H4UC98_9HYPO|nr:hypothetical protein FSARC_277 [Fusarium sarcochroum]
MTLPATYKAFRRTTGPTPRTIEPSVEAMPGQNDLGKSEVLIKIRAVSLNFRDVGMLNDRYPANFIEKGVPASDCAAEVVAIGEAVKSFNVGDRVAPIFNTLNLTGEEDSDVSGLGGDVEGVLRQFATFDESVLVRIPSHLSWEEASTLACAGVTAWTSLYPLSGPPRPRYALLQGTGGVSMFTLLLCDAAGVVPIITSSSDEKLENIKKSCPRAQTINYKTTSDQAGEVMRITNGQGVDVVINNTGIASIPSDIASLRKRGGRISLVGFLEGLTAEWKPETLLALMFKTAKLQGIGVGSKLDFVDLNQFLEDKKVHLNSIIDRVFAFDESKAAFDYLYSGKHVGKVVIKLD